MKKKKMSKKTKKWLYFFLMLVLSFCIIVLPTHYFSFLGMGPQSWSDILQDWWLIVPIVLFGAFWCWAKKDFDEEDY